MHSTTKYLGGHSDVLGGALIVRARTASCSSAIDAIQMTGGAVPSPFECWLTMRGIRTLPLRVQRADARARCALADVPRERIRASRPFTIPGCRRTRRTRSRASRCAASAACCRCRSDAIATSRSPSPAACSCSRRRRASAARRVSIEHRASVEGPGTRAPENLLRVSVGLEHVDDLKEDFDQALARLMPRRRCCCSAAAWIRRRCSRSRCTTGFDVHAMTFRYGQRHASEIDAARRVAARFGVRDHVVVDIDLRTFGGSALTSDIAVPKDRDVAREAHGDSDHVRARAQHDLSLVRARVGRSARRRRHLHRRERARLLGLSGLPARVHRRVRANGESRDARRRRGHERRSHPHAADRSDQGADHPLRPRARRRLLDHAELLRSGSERAPPAATATPASCASRDSPRPDSTDPAHVRLTPRDASMSRCTRSRKSSTRCRAKARTPDVPAVFCRFSGCNLWTGREADRATAICDFCDTDFVGVGPDGGKFATRRRARRRGRRALAEPTTRRNGSSCAPAASRCSSSTPPAIDALHARGFEVAVETNGTSSRPAGLDWICVSPKARAPSSCCDAATSSSSSIPQPDSIQHSFESLAFDAFLSPADGRPARSPRIPRAAMAYCLAHPRWRLSIQTHKLLGIR